MAQEKQMFRLFVSSTFNDLKAERNAMQEKVFCRLRDSIADYGHLQVIDLRWGVSEEASLDQQAMNICLKEIKRCKQITPKPNFIVLLGDRYGWRPPLSQIPDDEFKMILKKVTKDDRNFLKDWYTLDENAVPSEWYLNPRDPEGDYRKSVAWQPIESRLYRILSSAVKDLEPELKGRILHYTASATEQEIVEGVLSLNDAREHVHCFFRKIEGLPDRFDSHAFQAILEERIDQVFGGEKFNTVAENLITTLLELPSGSTPENFNEHIQVAVKLIPRNTIEEEFVDFILQTLINFTAKEFINLDDKGWTVDKEAFGAQTKLKEKLQDYLPEQNIHTYSAQWTGEGISTDHLDQFCEDVYNSLLTVIMEQVEHPREVASVEKHVYQIRPDEILDEEITAHHRFAEDLLFVFKGRKDVLKNIHAYLKDNKHRTLAIIGEGGTGKSALLAKAIQQTQENFPKAKIVYRFIGATPESSVGRSLLEGLCHEISRRFKADIKNIPTDYGDLVRELGKRMHLATAEEPLILFLDSLDQLSRTNDARSLTWLPSTLPEHVSVIATTRAEDTFENLKTKQAQIEVLEGLKRGEGEKLLAEWMGNAGRTLQERQKIYVLDKFEESKGNPLYLKLAFEEACQWKSSSGDHPEELDQGVHGIIKKNMFNRLQAEANHGEVLVSHALGYLAASRHGLAEDELVDLLSRDYQVYDWFRENSINLPPDLVMKAVLYRRCIFNQDVDVNEKTSQREERAAISWLKAPRKPPDNVSEFLVETLPKDGGLRLPIVLWSRLYLDLSAFLNKRLVNGNSLLNFSHREMGEASKEVFFANNKDHYYHNKIADYFADHRLDRRKIDELPWHYTQTGSWQNLYDLLVDLPFFTECYDVAPFEVREYWAQIERNSHFRLVEAYQPVINDPAQYDEIVWRIAPFLEVMGHYEEALSLEEFLTEHYRQIGDWGKFGAALGNQANIHLARGNLDGAMATYEEQDVIFRTIGNWNGLQNSLRNRAIILRKRGRLDKATELLIDVESICRELGDRDGLSKSLITQAQILEALGDQEEALELLNEAELIFRELGNKDGIYASYVNQANIHFARGDLDKAMALHKESEKICRDLGNMDGLSVSLGNQALILRTQGDLNGAMALHKEEERICHDLGNKDGLSRSINNQALILKDHNDLVGAMELFAESEQIYREVGNKKGLKTSLENQIDTLFKLDNLDGAMESLKEVEGIYRELEDRNGLQKSIVNQVSILRKQGNQDETMLLLKKLEDIFRESGNDVGLQASLGDQADILKSWGDLKGAVEIYRAQERISREMGNMDALLNSLSNQADILCSSDNFDEGLELLSEIEHICRETGNRAELVNTLNNKANILSMLDDQDSAMIMYKEQERICRDLGNKNALAISLINQAAIMGFQWNRIEEAIGLANEAYRLALLHCDNSVGKQIEEIHSQITDLRSG